jgi:hypothetical protein
MQIKNIQIFSSTTPANGAWVDISNLVSFSVYLTGLEASVWIEASNDPNAPIDGAAIGAPGVAPTLTQFASIPGSIGNSSMLPAATFYVETTFVTKWGETTASAESSLLVTAGNYLYVAPPVPSAAQAPYVTGYNVYVGLSSGAEVLQTGPQYQPQRLIDGIGTPGGTVQALGPNSSTHFAISGALPITTPFAMVNGFQQTQWVPPVSDQSGGASIGVNVSGTFSGSAAWTAPTPAAASQSQVTTNTVTSAALFNPSGICWKWLRVVKTTGSSLQTVGYLMGQNG